MNLFVINKKDFSRYKIDFFLFQFNQSDILNINIFILSVINSIL